MLVTEASQLDCCILREQRGFESDIAVCSVASVQESEDAEHQRD